MPRLPEHFPDIDLSAAGVTLSEAPPPEILATGWNSSAWRIGHQVFKITRRAESLPDADTLLLTMCAEHEVLANYLDDYMPETEYHVAPHRDDSHQARVVTVQPFIEGASLPGYLSDPDNPTDTLLEFLAKSKEVFKGERLMPDIACIEDGFNVLRGSNVLIDEKDGALKLVDTTFGKTQRSRQLGWLWTRLIYFSAIRAENQLRSADPRRLLPVDR